jgi:hypothetical protein
MYPNTESLIDLWDQRQCVFKPSAETSCTADQAKKGIGNLRISIAMIAHEVVLFVFGHLDLPA